MSTYGLGELGRAVVFGAGQLVVGGVVGTLLDSAFPLPDKGDSLASPVRAGLTSLEVAAQVISAGVFASFVVDWMVRYEDPQAGFALTLALVYSQPNAMHKMSQVSNYLKETVGLKERQFIESVESRLSQGFSATFHPGQRSSTEPQPLGGA